MAVCITSQSRPTARHQADSREFVSLLTGSGVMTIRVRSSGHDERLVRIRSPKCTVGSAAGCTLRLRAAGVGPLQCWILRGAQGTIVRLLHGTATLNGSRFDEAPLSVGDRLQMGSVELEMVACNEQLPAPLFAPVAAPLAER